jgi:hypothetical protein
VVNCAVLGSSVVCVNLKTPSLRVILISVSPLVVLVLISSLPTIVSATSTISISPSASRNSRMPLIGLVRAARPLMKPCSAFAEPSVKPQLTVPTLSQLDAFFRVAAADEKVVP